MSGWHCRHVAEAFRAGKCEGPRHADCGMRYEPSEYTLTKQGLILPGLGLMRMDGAASAPRGLPVIVYQDDGGWTAEFLKGTARPASG